MNTMQGRGGWGIQPGSDARPRQDEDPLAELARLVGDEKLFADLFRNGQTQHPVPEPHFDAGELRGSYAEDHGYAEQADFVAAGYEQQDGPDDYGYDLDVAEEEDAAAELSSTRRRTGLVTVAAVLGIAVIGGLGAVAYRSAGLGGSGDPPVIKAEATPAKIQADTNAAAVPHQNNKILDRVPGLGEPAEAKVVATAEEPVELPSNAPNSIRKILIPDADAATADAAAAGAGGAAASASATPHIEQPRTDAAAAGPATTASTNAPADSGPRKVSVETFKVDAAAGNAAVAGNDNPVTAFASTDEPTTGRTRSIATEGPAAGISIENNNTFDIMATEDAAPANAAGGNASGNNANAATAAASTDAGASGGTPVEVGSVPLPRAKPAAEPEPRTASVTPVTSGNPVRVVADDDTPAATRRDTTATTGATRVANAAPVATTAAAARGAFSIQVSSQRSEAEARSAYAGLQRRFPQILGNRQPTIVKADVPDRGTFYRVRVITGSRDDAVSLCQTLKAAGGDCVVQKN